MSDKDKQLFNEVFLQFHPILFHFGRKIISDSYQVEECIQELFLYIYQKEIDLAGIKHLKAYLMTSFRRRILLKKKNQQFEYLDDMSTDIQFFADDLPGAQEKEDTNRHLLELLNNLPWRQREAIFLKYFNHLSGNEIAEIMGVNRQVVANMIYKGLKKIREMGRFYGAAVIYAIFF